MELPAGGLSKGWCSPGSVSWLRTRCWPRCRRRLAKHKRAKRPTDSHEECADTLRRVEQFAKWRWNIDCPTRIPEWTLKACKLAAAPPGGPTFLLFPRDMLVAREVEAEVFRPGTFDVPMTVRPDAAVVEKMAHALIQAKSPLMLAGTDVWRFNAVPQVVELAELLAIPTTSGEEREGFRISCNFPTNHPLFLGGYSSHMRYPRSVDLLLNMEIG